MDNHRWIDCVLTKKLTSLSISQTSLAMGIAVGVLVSSAASANPSGGQVAAGQASITQTSPTRLDVLQHTDKAVIDWRSFNIGTGEHTHFQQPSSSAIALNRVKGGELSKIDGQLSANGQIFLINPHGVIFGKDSQVNVAGLLATSSDIDNDAFMAGRYDFNVPGDPSATIINRGQISIVEGGMAAFVAPGVENAGIIQARLGKVALASGNRYTLDLYGDNLVKLAVDDPIANSITGPDGQPLEALVNNSGEIIAEGGVVALTAQAARGVVDQVINMDGVVRTQSVEVVDGKIILNGGGNGIVAVSGTLDASGKAPGTQGGSVKVLGEKVALLGEGQIDVSGMKGGGEALVGGNYQGQGPEANAQATYIGPDTRITADATQSGDGGKVVVWADDSTHFHGQISARGGPEGGDGGLIETSSKKEISIDGATITASAANGQSGQWHIDPSDITIDSALANSIVESLEDGTSVFISTESSDNEAGDITVAADIIVDEPESQISKAFPTLRLEADNDIFVNARIESNLPFGSQLEDIRPFIVDLSADGDIEINQRIKPGNVYLGGIVTLEAGGMASVNNTINSGEISVNSLQNITISNSGRLLTGIGSIIANANGSIINNGTIDTDNGGSIDIQADTLTNRGTIRSLDGSSSTSKHIKLTANSITNEGEAEITAESANIELTADNFELDVEVQDYIIVGGSSIASDTMITLRPLTDGLDITIPSDEFLGISDMGGIYELGTINANTVVIGSENTGNIVFTGGVSRYLKVPNVVFVSGADVSQIGGTQGRWDGLGIIANTVNRAPYPDASFVTFTDRFAANISGDGAGILFTNTSITGLNGPLEIGIVGPVKGVTTNNGQIRISTALDLNIKESMDAGSEDISLFATGSIIKDTGANISARGLAMTADSIVMDGRNNNIDILAANILGAGIDFNYVDSNGLEIGSAYPGHVGINTNDGNITLTVDSGDLIISGNIDAGIKDVFLTVPNGAVKQTDGKLNAGALAVRAVTADMSVEDNDVNNLAASITGAGDPFRYTDSDAIEIAIVDSINGIKTNGGPVTITSDDILILQPITAVGSNVILRPLTTERQIDLGGDTSDVFSLSVNELDYITTKTLEVGSTSAGQLSVSAPLDLDKVTNFSLVSGAAIVQEAAAPITMAGLGLAGQSVTLNANNQVDLLAAELSGEGLSFDYTDEDGLAIGTVGSTSGITTNDGAVSLLTESGDLNINADINAGLAEVALTAPAGAIHQFSGTITAGGMAVTADSAEFLGDGNSVGRLAANITGAGNPFNFTGAQLEVDTVAGVNGITTNGGPVVLTTDDLSISQAITALESTVTLQPLTIGRAVDLGTKTPGLLGLDAAELARISASTLAVGNASAGQLTVSAPLDLTQVTNLSLVSGAAIVQNATAPITMAGLGLAGESVTLNANNQVDLLAAELSGLGLSFDYTDEDGLVIGTVGSTSGITTQDGTVNLVVQEGDLNILDDINAGQAEVALTASAGVINQSSGAINADGLAVTAESAEFLGDGNSVDRLAANITGSGNPFSLTTTGELEVGAVSTLNGIQTANGAVSLTANGGALTLTQGITAGTGDISLSASELNVTAGPDTLQSTGSLTIQPTAIDTTIGIGGGVGEFNLSETDLAAMANGFSLIYIGRADGAHSIDVQDVSFTDPVRIRAPAPGGTIFVNGQIQGLDDAAISLVGSGATTVLSNDIITESNPILIDDSVILAADVRLDTTNFGSTAGNDITITGPITGEQALTLIAGVGDLDLLATTGDPDALTQFTASASTIDVQWVIARDILLEDSGYVTGSFDADVSLSLFDVPSFDISATVAGLTGMDAMCATTVFPVTANQFINGFQVEPITPTALASTLHYLQSLAVPGRPFEARPGNPATAAYGGDPAKGGYSVTIFTDDYTLVKQEDSPDPMFEDLPYINDGFWEGMLDIRL